MAEPTAGAGAEAVPPGWEGFARGLVTTVAELEARAYVVVSSIASPPLYVQFAQTADDLQVSTGADDVLPAGQRLGPEGAERLRSGGWTPPVAGPAGQRAWHLALTWPARAAAYERLAQQCVVLFRDVHQVAGPDELEYRAWREAEPAPGGVTFYPEDLEPYEPHLVLPQLPIRDAQAESEAEEPAPAAPREVPLTGIAHPLVDGNGRGADDSLWSMTCSLSPVVHFSRARAHLLGHLTQEGQRAVLQTDERSLLTPSFVRIWRRAGGTWIILEQAGGMRNGFDGRRLTGVSESWTRPAPQTTDELAVRFLRPETIGTLQVTAVVVERHRARGSTLLGGTLERLAEAVVGASPVAWGPHEPVGRPWDRPALTALLREHMPAETAVCAVGPGLSATVSAQRTREGVEEVTHVVFGVGTPDEAELDRLRTRWSAVLEELATTGMPLAALLWARPGRADLLVPPFLLPPPVPLTLLIGAPGVRNLRPDLGALERLGARTVGRRRIPALIADLGPLDAQAWRRLDDTLGAFDRDLLAAALGPGAAELAAVRRERAAGSVTVDPLPEGAGDGHAP